MTNIAKQIRQALIQAGLKRVDISVKCKRNWVIEIKSKKDIKSIVEDVYYAKEHHWLVIKLNNDYLDMRRSVNVPCPFCYGGHFKPCQICGDSGIALKKEAL
jgi:molybdenum cofactor biosynthesis enzyme MoaA